MNILTTGGPALIGLIIGALAAFISWRHDMWDTPCTFAAIISGVLLAHTFAPLLGDVAGLEIFGVSLPIAVIFWGLTYVFLEGVKKINFHAYRTLILGFVLGAFLGLAPAGFHVSAPGAGALLVGEAAIFAYKQKAPKASVWFGLLGGLLLATALVPSVRNFTAGTGWSLAVLFFAGIAGWAEAYWSGHQRGPHYHPWISPAAGFIGSVLIVASGGGFISGFANMGSNATLTAVNTVGQHGNLLNDFFDKVSQNAVTVAHKAGGN
jgi:hypothetical protein